ncbi:hypothetical protein VFPBJ_00823 [Purpureocillium lilacinum]|uniref:Uncharacterized protein n=1 Tax=Purpureocillium lilacinum TaxID=33203 RepID=A0A179HBA0_PURLI|nr:hypothetical protein VFPBJ_00823 [Purpureocillium lilacinum]
MWRGRGRGRGTKTHASSECCRPGGAGSRNAHQAKGNLQDVALKGKVDEAIEEALHAALAAAEQRFGLAGRAVAVFEVGGHLVVVVVVVGGGGGGAERCETLDAQSKGNAEA